MMKQNEDETNKTLQKGRWPEVSETPPDSRKKAWLTDSLKVNSTRQRNGVLLPTESTYSSASKTSTTAFFSGNEKIIPIIAFASTGDRKPHNRISCSANSFIPDYLRIRLSHIFLTSLQLFNEDIKAIKGSFWLSSSSIMNEGLTPR